MNWQGCRVATCTVLGTVVLAQKQRGARLSPSEAAFNMVNQNGSSVTDPGLAFQSGC